MTQRPASHAGSWYSDDGPTLSKQLDQWLDRVPDAIPSIGDIPQPGARVIIAPHAGYAYSGPAAAWAYKSLDLSRVKRIFLLGPSHHAYLPNLALSQHTTYATPLGPLPLDLPTIRTLHATGHFGQMSPRTDADEHSLEMHLPYIHKVLSRAFPNANTNTNTNTNTTADAGNGATSSLPPLIPILVGNTSPAAEKTYGKLLAPYLADPTSVFVVSSDFCHWGTRFSYTYYIPSPPSTSWPIPFPTSSASASSSSQTPSSAPAPPAGYHLSAKLSKPRPETPIHASIAHVDALSMRAVESGSHEAFLANLRETGNTVCGRHPIGVVMAALEVLASEQTGGEEEEEEGGRSPGGKDGEEGGRSPGGKDGEEGGRSPGGKDGEEGRMAKGRFRFRFIRYEQSSECVSVRDSSVSYASAFAVL